MTGNARFKYERQFVRSMDPGITADDEPLSTIMYMLSIRDEQLLFTLVYSDERGCQRDVIYKLSIPTKQRLA
jgi:hypothetical protein